MKKNFLVLASIALNVLLVFFLASCGGDDDNNKPADKALISFSESSRTVNEADGTIEIEVTLDKPATERISIDYDLSGSALDKASLEDDYDYEIASDYGTVKIEKGETTGTIQVKLYSDLLFEDDNPDTDPIDPETIVISLSDVSGSAEINPDKNEMTINIDQEDGKAILLEWEYDAEVAKDSVDMDLFLWIGDLGDDISSFEFLDLSAYEDYEGPEFIFLPSVIDNASFGLTFNYYDGNVEPMEFNSIFVDFKDGVIEEAADQEKFTGTYTLANLNPWNPNEPVVVQQDVFVEQTFDVEDGIYSTPSDIITPESKSRTGASQSLPAGLQRKSHGSVPKAFRKLLQ